jgi:hypothetical protein
VDLFVLVLFLEALILGFALVLAEVHSVGSEGQVTLLGEPYAISCIRGIHDLMLIGMAFSAVSDKFDL